MVDAHPTVIDVPDQSGVQLNRPTIADKSDLVSWRFQLRLNCAAPDRCRGRAAVDRARAHRALADLARSPGDRRCIALAAVQSISAGYGSARTRRPDADPLRGAQLARRGLPERCVGVCIRHHDRPPCRILQRAARCLPDARPRHPAGLSRSLLAIALVAALGPNLPNLVFTMGLLFMPRFARVARASTLSVRERDYIAAAIGLGVSRARILYRHVLPNIAAPLIVEASLTVTIAILTEASLSFLGLGVQPPDPTWGGMIAEFHLGDGARAMARP